VKSLVSDRESCTYVAMVRTIATTIITILKNSLHMNTPRSSFFKAWRTSAVISLGVVPCEAIPEADDASMFSSLSSSLESEPSILRSLMGSFSASVALRWPGCSQGQNRSEVPWCCVFVGAVHWVEGGSFCYMNCGETMSVCLGHRSSKLIPIGKLWQIKEAAAALFS
jgi:hypothetical protein